jgi:flagella basal body P-ring formation protein FlgA
MPVSATTRRRIAAFALTALLSPLASAAGENARNIQAAIETFVHAQTQGMPGQVEVKSGQVDPQLRLAPCNRIEAFLPPGAKLWGNSTVGVRCEAPEKWSLYVPVQVRVYADVVLSARALPRGETIGLEDLATQRLDLTQLQRGVFVDVQQVVGKVAKTAIGGGTPLTPELLRAPPVVLQGQVVRLVFSDNGISVSSEGRALGNAGVGEPVQVKAASGKLIKGIVSGPGEVRVR